MRDTFFTRAYPNPVIEVFSNPDTAFIQKPYVNFEYVNKSADSIRVTSQYWEMGDESQREEQEKPMHTYTEIGDYKVVLSVYNSFGCDTVYFKDVMVMPIKLSIPNFITPNNDGINDALYDEARSRIEQLAKQNGFEGRLVILSDPDIQAGDCKLEWADGGVAIDRAATDAKIAELVSRYMASRKET